MKALKAHTLERPGLASLSFTFRFLPFAFPNFPSIIASIRLLSMILSSCLPPLLRSPPLLFSVPFLLLSLLDPVYLAPGELGELLYIVTCLTHRRPAWEHP